PTINAFKSIRIVSTSSRAPPAWDSAASQRVNIIAIPRNRKTPGKPTDSRPWALVNMTRSNPTELPACYAMVHEGLEGIAAEEIAQSLGGKVKRSGGGIVVFRVNDIDRDLLRLRTTEDVFLYGWG